MAGLIVADNFLYKGKKPLDARAQFDSLASLASFDKAYIPEGFVTYCLEDKKNYKFSNGEWEEHNPKTEEYYGYYTKLNTISDYAYEAYYNELNYALAYKKFAEDNIPEFAGGCSSVRVGNMYGRNLDWLYNEQAEFVLHTPSIGGRYATTCTCGQVSGLTDSFVKTHKYSEDYIMLPFYCVDGINEKGVFINVNVVPAEKGNTEKFIEPAGSKEVEICANMIPRYVLDNFATALEAVTFIRDHMRIYFSKKLKELFGYEPHFMIGDKESTYIVEFAENKVQVYNCDIDLGGRTYMTNFHLTGTEFNDSGAPLLTPATAAGQSITAVNKITPDGAGLERYNLIDDLVKNGAPVRYIMNMLMYTKTYTADGLTDKWYTELVGTPVTPGGTDYVTVDSAAADFETIWARVNGKFPNRTRDPQDPNPDAFYGSWQTTHSVVYNIDTMEAEFIFQENVDAPHNIEFEANSGSGIDEFNTTEAAYLADLPEGIFKLSIMGEEVGLCVKKEGGVQLITGAHDRYCRTTNRAGEQLKVEDLMKAYDTRTNVRYDDWYQQIDYNNYLRLLSKPTTRAIQQLEGGLFPEGMVISFVSEFDNDTITNIGIDDSSRFLIMDVDGVANWEKPFKIKKGERYSFYFHRPESEDPIAPSYFYYIGNKNGLQNLNVNAGTRISSLPTGAYNAIVDDCYQGIIYVDKDHTTSLVGKYSITMAKPKDDHGTTPISCTFVIDQPNTEVWPLAEADNIDWGDGSGVVPFAWSPHTYVKPGEYDVIFYKAKYNTSGDPIGDLDYNIKYLNVPLSPSLMLTNPNLIAETLIVGNPNEFPFAGGYFGIDSNASIKRLILEEYDDPGMDESYYIIVGFDSIKPYPGYNSVDVFVLQKKEYIYFDSFMTNPTCDVNIYLKDDDFEAQKAKMIVECPHLTNDKIHFKKLSEYNGDCHDFVKYAEGNVAVVDNLFTINKVGQSLEDRVTALENAEPSGGEGIKTIEVQPTDLLKNYEDGTFVATYGSQIQGLVIKSSQGVTLVNGEGVRRMDYVIATSATASRDATAQDLLLAYPQTSMGYRSDFTIEPYDSYYGILKLHRPSDMANMRPNIVGSPPIKDGYTFSFVAAANYSGVGWLEVDGQKHEIAPQSMDMYMGKEYTFYYYSNLFYLVNGQALTYKVRQTYQIMQEDDPGTVKYYVPYIEPSVMMNATLLCKDGRAVVFDYEADETDPVGTSGAYIITSATVRNMDDIGKVINLIIDDPANKIQLSYEFYIDSGDYKISEISNGGGETVDLTPIKKSIRDLEAIIPPVSDIGEQYGDGAPQFSFYWNNRYYVIFAMSDSDWRGMVYLLQEYNSPTDQEPVNREQFNFGDNNYQYIAGIKQIGGRIIIYGSAYDRGIIARSPLPQGPDDSLLNYSNVMASWDYQDVSSDSGMATILDVVDIGCEPGNRYSHWLGMIGQYYPFYNEQRVDQLKMTMCRFDESSENFELRDLTDNSLYFDLPFRHFKLLLHPNWNWNNLNRAFIIAAWSNANDEEGSAPTYVYSGGLDGSMNRQLIYGPTWGVSVVDHDFVMCCNTGDYEPATMVYVPLPDDPDEWWPDDDDFRFYNISSQINGVPFLYTDRYLLATPPYDDHHATLYYIDENKVLLVDSIPTEKISTRDDDNIFRRATRLEIDNDGSIYMYIAAGDALYVYGKHLNMVRTIKGSNRLATNAKDIVGAINELVRRIAEIERRL